MKELNDLVIDGNLVDLCYSKEPDQNSTLIVLNLADVTDEDDLKQNFEGSTGVRIITSRNNDR